MTTPISVRQIIKKIGCDKLFLIKGDGYWYFMYDDVPNSVYEEQSVYCMYLNDMSLDQWVENGQDFVKQFTSK